MRDGKLYGSVFATRANAYEAGMARGALQEAHANVTRAMQAAYLQLGCEARR